MHYYTVRVQLVETTGWSSWGYFESDHPYLVFPGQWRRFGGRRSDSQIHRIELPDPRGPEVLYIREEWLSPDLSLPDIQIHYPGFDFEPPQRPKSVPRETNNLCVQPICAEFGLFPNDGHEDFEAWRDCPERWAADERPSISDAARRRRIARADRVAGRVRDWAGRVIEGSRP